MVATLLLYDLEVKVAYI